MQLLRRLKKERGMTLVEMMVVVTILGLLATVSATLVTTLFTANLRSSQLGSQQTTIENAFGFLSSRVALAPYDGLGMADPANPAVLNPLSLSGDQLLFTSNYGGDQSCFRIVYLAALKEVRVASQEGDCNASGLAIAPRRGPNAAFLEGNSPFRLPGESLFDPVIDSAYPAVQDVCQSPDPSQEADCTEMNAIKAWTLAQGIANYPLGDDKITSALASVPGVPLQPGGDNILPFFAYTDRSGEMSPQWGASSGCTVPLYAGQAGAVVGTENCFGGVTAQAYVSAVADTSVNDEKVRPRFYQQKYSLQQLCFLRTPAEYTGGALTGSFFEPQLAEGAVNNTGIFTAEALPFDFTTNDSPVTISTDTTLGIFSEWGDLEPGRYMILAELAADAEAEIAPLRLEIRQGGSVIATQLALGAPAQLWAIRNINPSEAEDIEFVASRIASGEDISLENTTDAVRISLQWVGPS